MNPEATMFIIAAVFLSPRMSDHGAILCAMVLSILGFIIGIGRLL